MKDINDNDYGYFIDIEKYPVSMYPNNLYHMKQKYNIPMYNIILNPNINVNINVHIMKTIPETQPDYYTEICYQIICGFIICSICFYNLVPS
jgi:hypothetical protein